MMTNTKTVRVWHDDAWRSGLALTKRGGDYHVVLITDAGVRRITATDRDIQGELSRHGRPYPIKRMVQKLRGAGRRMGMTKAARVLLRKASQSEPERA